MHEDPIIAIIGNKSDLRKLDDCDNRDEMIKYCLQNDFPYYEVSAFDDQSIQAMFESALDFYKRVSNSKESLKIFNKSIELERIDDVRLDDCCY